MEMLVVLAGFLALTATVDGQDQSGFISIDCGMAEGTDYNDATTSILYTSDAQFIDTGTNKSISPDLESENLPKYLSSVRAFPEGLKNCYTFKLVQGNKYLIRSVFMYGNYDSKNQAPEFGLYLNADEWDSVKLENSSDVVVKEIIHVQETNYSHVCLVNTGLGTPFISALELRLLNSTIYKTQSASLVLATRLDIGSTSNDTIRFKDDDYDRIWKPYTSSSWELVSLRYASDLLSANPFILPPRVMTTAVTPKNGSRSLELQYDPDDATKQFYVYMHFAEVEELGDGGYRNFTILLNGDFWYGPMSVQYLSPVTVYSQYTVSGTSLELSLVQANDSKFPPILNAVELYWVKEFLQSPTEQSDGEDLSSSGLSGKIDSSLSNLESLQYLDLSNNSLTGEVPDFLSQLPLLKTLNLSGNEFTGSVPSLLIQRSKNGSLSLSVDGNPNLCVMASCNNKKSVVIPVIASIAVVLVLLIAFLILWGLKRRRQQRQVLESKANYEEDGRLESKNLQFTYSELVNITNNFQKVLGKGGFGSVYGGYLNDGTQVAVKMLSEQSAQGFKEFRSEAQLLTKVHHRNLAPLIGYCNEGRYKGIVYEYMANGNLREHLSGAGKDTPVLSWEQRLQIAVDAAQAFEYLHEGCKPPIIHRDVKTSNILLDGKLQAKVADFGLSRFMPSESRTIVSTQVAGTPGYLDPEYYISNNLNEKSDVYAFGIVLLELVTGHPAIIPGHENTHLVDWLSPRLAGGEIRSIVDSRLNGDFNPNSAWKLVETAMACVPRSSIQRPTMSQVVADLKECLQMEMHRNKSASQSRTYQDTASSANSIDLFAVELDVSMPHAR
ncbi:hypothetical protein VitviT2T_013299 [Vitis vinifera]|uniref:non-specific serine/threonine protein kinase n=1 Tax=Vitis vinifera TaxID=29760 RepID=A0ABY9CHD9_VITVI|nr:hypothetical protein VitviT2T_013299 [Vitis vinifera]